MSIESQLDHSHTQSREVDGPADRFDEDGDAGFLTLNVRLADGSRFECEAAEGFRVVELIRAYGLPIKAECGGSGVCATCHVRVAGNWRERLAPPSDDELAKLDEIATAGEDSRLACQIEMTAGLDGLELLIDPDSLHDRTNQTAG
ncbi:MAG: 2Fe-2S iron-sulfur cluster binding domain-containing protein [Hyphomicrobiaceae bacterium]|nr:2Fe-2S iron-sulfur cluster binding domain-containing protein [Hyphomicrobiaceae bacterium]